MRRVLLDMSQATLAEALGVSFQQVQKYEKGMNKIGAGRLLQISTALNVCPSFFFECLPVTDGFEVPAAEEAPSDEVAVTEFLSSVDGLRLIRAFVLIRDAKARKKAVDFVASLAEGSTCGRRSRVQKPA
nr:helix-turn-helix domain-containing protein [Candidatus Rhodoblastus alkanivorans]